MGLSGVWQQNHGTPGCYLVSLMSAGGQLKHLWHRSLLGNRAALTLHSQSHPVQALQRAHFQHPHLCIQWVGAIQAATLGRIGEGKHSL